MSTEEIAKKTESLVENEPLKDFWAKVFKNNDVLGNNKKIINYKNLLQFKILDLKMKKFLKL